MSLYARHASPGTVSQSEPLPGKPMVPNNAGGFAFAVDRWKRLERFLCLGGEGGTYYVGERKLTLENAASVRECLAEDAARTVGVIVAISDAGRAPKNDPAIFALALAATARVDLVIPALPSVCRTGTHLLTFVECVKQLRGFGSGVRKAIGGWYAGQTPENLAYQVTKYVSRGGWSHRDVLRKVGPPAPSPAHAAIYRWIAKGLEGLGPRVVERNKFVKEYPGHEPDLLPRIIHAYETLKATKDVKEVVRLIRDERIPREFLEGSHSEMLNHAEVWEALLDSMPLTALIRNLGKMTAVGLLSPLSAAAETVCDRLADSDHLRKSRIHPLGVLLAATTYASGRGVKGSLTWSPVSKINDALEAAFYAAFGNVEPAGKRTLMGLDVSGSMSSPIAGTHLSCAVASAAMAMVLMKTEPQYQLMAFDAGIRPLDISRYSRLTDVVRNTSNINCGGTDCSLPMLYASQHGLQVDTFQVYTDSETWAGRVHPSFALQEYRNKTGIAAKLIVVGMASNGFTIADPSDAGMLDVVGFDAATPNVMTDFARN